MSTTVKEGNSFLKKHLENARIAHVASRTITFYHQATSGQGTISLNALTMPVSLTGVTQISPEEIVSARLWLHRKNIVLSSSLKGLLYEGEDYTIADSLSIVLLGSKFPTGATAGEVFYGRVFCSPLSELIVATAKSVTKTYTGSTGLTLNLGLEYKVNDNSLQNIGQIKIWKNGSLLRRNTNNSSSTVDADYYEVNAGNGYGTTVQLSVSRLASDKFVVDFGVRAITDNNAIGEIERLNTAILSIATDLAALNSQPLSKYILVNPSETERRAFGDLVLSLQTTVGTNTSSIANHESRITTLESSVAGSQVVDSMAGTETNKAPSVSSVKTYINAKVVNSMAGSETTSAPSVSSVKTYIDAKVVNSTAGSETTAAPSVASMKTYVQSYLPPSAAVAALDISFSAVNQIFTKSLSVNSTFTFSNLTDGKMATLAVTNSGGSDITLTFPTLVKDATFTTTVTAGKTNMYTFVRTSTTTFATCVSGMS